MPSLGRIRSAWDTLIERLRSIWTNSQTVVLNIEVTYDSPESTDSNLSKSTSDTDSRCEGTHQGTAPVSDDSDVAPSDSCRQTTDRGKTTTHTLYVQFSDRSIAVDGSQTRSNKGVLTEDCLTTVLKNHPKIQGVSQLVVTRHSQLTSIPVFIGKLKNLTALDLSGNSLQDLPWSIVYLNKLKILNLSCNRFYTVPPIVGRLTNLEQLLLNSNCLEYLPTSFLHLEKLRVLQVSENQRLIAPPLAVCNQGLDAVFRHLRKRRGRRNVWSDSTQFYRLVSSDGSANSHAEVKTLLEMCVAAVLQFNMDFFSQSYFPPPLKRHLYDQSKVKMAAVRVAKCSQCHAFFSSEAFFDGHDCRR